MTLDVSLGFRTKGTQATLRQKEPERVKNCTRRNSPGGQRTGPAAAPRSQQLLLGLSSPRGQDRPRRLQQDFLLLGRGGGAPASQPGTLTP